MPDPTQLKVGDRVRFIAIPDEWADPQRSVPRESRAFMKRMLKRRYSSRIYEVDEYGYPWIKARLIERSKIKWHYWGIMESSGWRKVEQRTKR